MGISSRVMVAVTAVCGCAIATVGALTVLLPSDPPVTVRAGNATASTQASTDCKLVSDPYFETPEFSQRHPELLARVAENRDRSTLCISESEEEALSREQSELQATAAAAGKYLPKGPDPRLTIESGKPDAVGLVDNPDQYTPASEFIAQNAWIEQHGTAKLIIAAGYRPASANADDGQTTELGGVLVTWWPRSGGSQQILLAPPGTPRLEIARVADGIVHMLAQDGTQVSFDIARRSLTRE